MDNTIILDAFMFKPKDCRDGLPDLDCHDLVKELLHEIRPDFVIACCGDMLGTHWLKHWISTEPRYAPHIKTVVAEAWSTRGVHSFHPGYCVNNVRFEPKARLLLLLTFMLAFIRETARRNAILDISSTVELMTQPWVSYH